MYRQNFKLQPVPVGPRWMDSNQNQRGSGFFSDVGSFFKSAGNKIVDTLKKPSTYLGAAGMLPTPLAPIFKGASLITRMAGQGRKKRKGAKKKQAGGKKRKTKAGGKRKKAVKRKK